MEIDATYICKHRAYIKDSNNRVYSKTYFTSKKYKNIGRWAKEGCSEDYNCYAR